MKEEYINKWKQAHNMADFLDIHDLFSDAEYSEMYEKYKVLLDATEEDKKKLIHGFVEESIKNIVDDKQLSTGIAFVCGNDMYSFSYAWGEDGNGNLIDETTLFDIASITKLFLSIVYMKLWEMKKISLDWTIAEISSRFQNISKLKLKDLLSYTVSLTTSKRLDDCISAEEALSILGEIQGEKSDKQIYSDMPSMVLAELLVDITGKNFGQWIEDLFIKPLNLKNTHWDFDVLIKHNCVNYDEEHLIVQNEVKTLYNPCGKVHDPKARLISETTNKLCGNAGLFISYEDMSKIAQALVRGKIIGIETWKKMVIGAGWDKCSDRETYGYICYRKYKNKKQSEVHFPMSGYALAMTGYTGTYLMLDCINKTFVFIGGNRLRNRIAKVVGENTIADLPYIYTKDFVYERDLLKDIGSEITLFL